MMIKKLLMAIALIIIIGIVQIPINQKNATYSHIEPVVAAATADLTFPTFKWPWPSSENGKIYWTSGPHSWSRGGNLTTKISADRGNGLDFAKSEGASFTVVSMASGTVIKNQCGYSGLGCIVAIKHDTGGSVMIYAHLKSNASSTAPDNSLQEGKWYSQQTIVGYAGNSGGQSNVHLHIELRDGGSCYAPANSVGGANNGNDCGDVGFAGSPVGWDGRQLVDGYYVNGYFDSENFCGPGADCMTIFNYDGSAVKGSISAPFINFPYYDNGVFRTVMAFVHPNFIDNNICNTSTNCEINTNDTVFADQGKFSGGGGLLYSTNGASNPPPPPDDTSPPSGYYTSPSNGSTIYSSNVNISVNASDNSGGSGVREVRFSAKWDGTWRGIGVDYSTPYSINWNMCAAGVANGDIELGMEVWDNANNKWVYSQHYTNIHINKNYSCPVDPPPPSQTNGVDLFTDPNFSGYHFVTPLTYDLPNLGTATGGLFHDNIESARVIGQYSYVLYESENYGGAHVYQTGHSNLNDIGWGNRADSIRVRNGDYNYSAFTLYDLGDFNAEAWSSDRTIHDLGHWNKNDWAESIKIASGYGIVACEHSNFHGNCGRVTGPAQFSDINALQQGLRNGVSSIRVCTGSCPDGASFPTLVYPSNGSNVTSGTPINLQWYGGGNQFRLELWGGALSNVQTWGWSGETQFNAGILPVSSNPYYWKVQASNGFGDSGWSQGSFYVSNPSVKAISVFVNSGATSNSFSPLSKWPSEAAILGASKAASSFSTGDPINLYIRAQNTFSSGSTAYFEWKVSDPLGRSVSALSWKGYLTTPSGTIDWFLPTSIPEFAISGEYTFTGSIIHADQTTTISTSFEIEGPVTAETIGVYIVESAERVRADAPNIGHETVIPDVSLQSKEADTLEYTTGDTIQLHMLIYNNANTDLTVGTTWMVIDPQGRKINALSYTGNLSTGSGLKDWYLENSIPANAISGEYYFFGEVSYNGRTTEVASTFHIQGDPPASFDNVNTPFIITSQTFSSWFDTWNTSASPGDPQLSCTSGSNSNSVWFQFTAPSSSHYSINTAGSYYDTVAAVFIGNPGNFTEIACNDDFGSTVSSYLTFYANEGDKYYILIMDWNNPGGGTLHFQLSPQNLVFLPFIKR